MSTDNLPPDGLPPANLKHKHLKHGDLNLENLNQETLNQENLNLLVTLSMPYGKYKGRLLADLPGNYLNWFARQGFPAGQLGRLLALMQEIDHNGLSHLLQPLKSSN